MAEEQHAYLIQSITRGDYHQAAVASGAAPTDIDYEVEEDEADAAFPGDVYVDGV